MDRQLRLLRIFHAAFLIAALLYVYLAEALVRESSREIDSTVYLILAVVGAAVFGTIFVIREKFLGIPTEMLRTQPDDAEALRRWRGGHFVMFAMAEAIVLYGFIARFMGASWARAAPFYAVGMILLLVFYPRRP